jgi:hypothetical protein
MKNLDLTTDEIVVILGSISDSMDKIYSGPEGLSECMKIELEIMNNLKRKLEKLL